MIKRFVSVTSQALASLSQTVTTSQTPFEHDVLYEWPLK